LRFIEGDTVTLVELLRAFNFEVKKVASTHGGEFAGPCPFCGGKDRFRVWPLQGKYNGKYWCRNCSRHGDSVQFLREFKEMSFNEALAFLGKEENMNVIPISKGIHFKPRKTVLPSDVWTTRAALLIEISHKKLLDNEKHVDFLSNRGLTRETIIKAKLGWNPVDIYTLRTSWGLESNGKKLWIPSGLVIPYLVEKKPIRIRIRRFDGDPRYYLVPGSDTRAMLLGHGGTLTIVESELDGLLVYQESQDISSVIALGSAQIRPDIDADVLIKQAKIILGAFDYDDAGMQARLWWQEKYPNFRRWPVVIGKDPSEAYQRGMPIRPWIQAGIDEANKQRVAQKRG